MTKHKGKKQVDKPTAEKVEHAGLSIIEDPDTHIEFVQEGEAKRIKNKQRYADEVHRLRGVLAHVSGMTQPDVIHGIAKLAVRDSREMCPDISDNWQLSE